MTYKCIEFGAKEFPSLDAMHYALLKNMDKLIDLKKAQIHKSYQKGQISIIDLYTKSTDAVKAAIDMKEGFFYPVINSTRYMDSHKDVHFDGIWNKSLKDQKGNLFYVMDHDLKIKSVIAWPQDVNAFVKNVPWSFVGKSYPGDTQALIYEIDKRAIDNDEARKVISEKKPVQNSVRMQYVKLSLGVNNPGADFRDQKSYYDKHINSIANKEVAEEDGYFWGVEEAKIAQEGSMVLYGSNDATPIQYFTEADTFTSIIEPQKSTQPIKTIFDYLN